jgi:nucleotide-binding universal stress UspA family protein
MEDVRGRRILVALDESEESMYALKWARDYLHLDSTDTLILCHSKCLPIAYEGLGGPWFTLTPENKIELEKYQERVTEAIMQKARDICSGSPAKVEEKTVKEDARDALCDAVKKVRADFLVVGSHGYGTVKRALLGSVSSYCAHHAKCPVMIIKKPHEHKA